MTIVISLVVFFLFKAFVINPGYRRLPNGNKGFEKKLEINGVDTMNLDALREAHEATLPKYFG